MVASSAASCLVADTFGRLFARGVRRFEDLLGGLEREVEEGADLSANEDLDVCLVTLPERVDLAGLDGIVAAR